MAVTGLLRWAGVPHEYVWHGGIGYLVLGLAGYTCGRFGVLCERGSGRGPGESGANSKGAHHG